MPRLVLGPPFEASRSGSTAPRSSLGLAGWERDSWQCLDRIRGLPLNGVHKLVLQRTLHYKTRTTFLLVVFEVFEGWELDDQ